MTQAVWLDCLATVRYVVGQILPIVTAIGGGLAAYYAYKSKTVGERNSGHLLQQDATIHAIGSKVEVLTASAAPDPLRSRVNGLMAELDAIRNEPGPGG